MADDFDDTGAIATDDQQVDLPMYRQGVTPQDSASDSFNRYREMGLSQPDSSPATTDDDYVPVPGGGIAPGAGAGAIPVEDDASGVDKQVRGQASQGLQVDEYGRATTDADQANSPGNLAKGTNALLKMLQGEGAVNPTMLPQINEQARRSEHDTPADLAVYAIDDAAKKHGPDAAAALVQANRLVYDTSNATAMKALAGTPQKRPDLKRAIDEANKAQTAMPDGANIIFSPNGNHGVIAVAQLPGQKHTVQYNLDIPQFKQFLDVSHGGQFDKVFNRGSAGLLQELSDASSGAGQDVEGGGRGSSGNGDRKLSTYESGKGWKQLDKNPGEGNGEGNVPGAKDVTAADERPGQGKPRPVQNQQPQGDGQDKDIEDATRRAYKLFPWMSQQRQRAAFIQRELATGSEQNNKLAVAQQQGANWQGRVQAQNEGRLAVADANNGSKERMSEARNATWRYSTDQKRQAAADRLAAMERAEIARNGRSDRSNEMQILRTKINQGQLNDEDQARLKRFGLAADQSFAGAPQAPAPQAQAPQAQAQAQAPQGQYAPAPANPQDRQVGQTYVSKSGRVGTWTGNGWKVQ